MDMLLIKQAENGAIIEARVRPSSGKFSIKADKGEITIHTKSPPEGNKANMEIVKELSRLFGMDVRMLQGLKSRRKQILVAGASPHEVEALLG